MRFPTFRHRAALLTTLLVLMVASLHAPAQENRLPDIGSSAGTVLAPAQQAEYGRMLLAQLRHYGYVLEDPLVEGWLQTTGNRLGAVSDDPEQKFTFFMMKDRSINAFATLGGYIGMNAGLVLAAEKEDEVAAVLGHEIAHVTQAHVLRSVERAQRDSIPILLAMLGAIAIAQSAGGNSSDDAAMAAMATAQGLAAQRHVPHPAGARQHLYGADERRARATRGHAVADVAQPHAGQRQIDGEDQHRAPRRLGPHQQLAHIAPVLEHIELEPGRGSGGRDLLYQTDAHRRKAERHARLGRGPGRLNLAAAAVHSGHPDRRQAHRHVQLLPEHLDRHIQIGHVTHDPLPQGDGLQIGDVPPQRHLGVGAAVDVLEEHLRQAAARQLPIVRN